MKWGLFGGTFDPIHIGHLRCAEEIRQLIGLDRVIFIPASCPPHKTDVAVSDFRDRERMVRLAVADNPHFDCSDIEGQRAGKSYSVETVAYFQETFPQAEIYFIVGQDAFQAIQTWKEWGRLLGMCHFVVMTRPGWENKGLAHILPPERAGAFVFDAEAHAFRGPTGCAIYFREVTLLDISSSGIRTQTARGASIRYLVPEAVKRYLEEKRLYS